jgi:hypothetical protein
MNRFEVLLREVDPELSLHYWDWTTDPGWMFTNQFMGSPSGDAGDPWLSAGFYDPNPTHQNRDTTGNPADPPQHVTRSVRAGAPFTAADDQQLINNSANFVDFDNNMAGPHATAHGWIGGTLSNPHTSFRDPVVFLLHSNVDRLFAMWQTQPGHSERLDPQQVYGAYSNTRGSGDVNTLHPNWGILSPLEPWAGPGAQTAATGIIANVHATRPWAAPEHQEIIKDSKHPTVVAPPLYDSRPPYLAVANFGYNAGSWRVDMHPRFLADVTGDRRADIVGFGNEGVWIWKS